MRGSLFLCSLVNWINYGFESTANCERSKLLLSYVIQTLHESDMSDNMMSTVTYIRPINPHGVRSRLKNISEVRILLHSLR